MSSEATMNDDVRMAAIGRAVVEYLMPDNPRALRQATPEAVVDNLKRDRLELTTLQTCDALRVGQRWLDIARITFPDKAR
jgi:hypothetical protein